MSILERVDGLGAVGRVVPVLVANRKWWQMVDFSGSQNTKYYFLLHQCSLPELENRLVLCWDRGVELLRDWDNGFHNDKLSVELHIGTNVGVNYCTDAFLDEEIAQIYYPIDPSELPEDLIEDETAVFDYSLLFLDCEDCEPLAMLTVENFWFRSELGTYAKVGLVNHLQSDIWLDFGG